MNAAAAAAVADGSWGRYFGPHGDRLREALATFHGVGNVRLCSSGTAAVELALRGLGVGAGDEVMLAAYDFEANIKNVLALGAMPILAEIRPDDAQLDVSRLADIESPRIKAVLVSHLHGGIVNMPALRELADRRGWGILEDVCQSPGAWVYGKRAGTWGDVGVMSFGGSKLLTAGRGGAIFSARDDVMQRIRLHVERGNDLSPLSEIQSALLLPQLSKLDERNSVRAKNALRLAERLGSVAGLTPFPHPKLDIPRPTQPVHYKLAAWYDRDAFEGLRRETFAVAMRAEGISFWPGFRGLHRTHSNRRFRSFGPLSNADRADEQLLVLHHPVLLGSESEIELIAEAAATIRRFAAAIRDAVPPTAYDELGR
ncbi:MAG: DegT/DnrJ/EryC1/StrS family aminotransferase [Planctomycetota bacterium]|nr:DegT/DnrJ/EryC1/StrS family aminotransferase [Planctomycetota bacterium]